MAIHSSNFPYTYASYSLRLSPAIYLLQGGVFCLCLWSLFSEMYELRILLGLGVSSCVSRLIYQLRWTAAYEPVLRKAQRRFSLLPVCNSCHQIHINYNCKLQTTPACAYSTLAIPFALCVRSLRQLRALWNSHPITILHLTSPP
jgi:hypothetical protein